MSDEVGRIREHSPDWKFVVLEGDDDRLSLGSLVRLKWHRDAEFRRGTATVFSRVDDQVWFTQPLYVAIPAAADLDYMYLVGDVDA